MTQSLEIMSLRRKLLEFYWGMERRIVPGLEYSQHRYEEHLRRWIPDGVTWLDVGCGRRLLTSWRAEGERILLARAKSLVGIDLDLDSLRDNVTVKRSDRQSCRPTSVPGCVVRHRTANMVVEHLDDPGSSFTEVARVLKPGGLFLFHTPNANAFPTALARLVPDAIKAPMARLLDRRRSIDVFQTYYRCNTAEDIHRSATSGQVPVEMSFVSSTALFAVVPPLAFLELLWLRRIRNDSRQHLRSNLIAVLRKN